MLPAQRNQRLPDGGFAAAVLFDELPFCQNLTGLTAVAENIIQYRVVYLGGNALLHNKYPVRTRLQL